MKLRARATGDLGPTLLNLDASLKRVSLAATVVGENTGSSTDDGGNDGNEPTNPGNQGGGGTAGGDDLEG